MTGPGSPSTLGFLQELGPLLLNATGGLMSNPYSWTKLTNVFVIESPVGVGYSYCSAQAEGKVCRNTDKFTASTARAAMVDFFRNKFPELAQNDFYITGELLWWKLQLSIATCHFPSHRLIISLRIEINKSNLLQANRMPEFTSQP